MSTQLAEEQYVLQLTRFELLIIDISHHWQRDGRTSNINQNLEHDIAARTGRGQLGNKIYRTRGSSNEDYEVGDDRTQEV